MAKYKTNQQKDREIIKLNKEQISEIINISLASAKIKKILVEEEGKDFLPRTNINLYVYGIRSSTKSTIMEEIRQQTHCPGTVITHLTTPALVGSIDNNTKQVQPGACWDCRNSFLFLDEFDFNRRDKELIRALLQLTEGGVYVKKIASFCMPFEEHDNNLFYIVKNGKFDIKSRFSLILATMTFPYASQNKDLQALVSRCIAIPLYLTKADLMKIANGYPLYNFVDLTPKKLDIKVNKKDYKKILDFIDKRLGEDSPNLLRIIGDCVRIFAVLGKHREDLYEIMIKLGDKKFAGDIVEEKSE